MSPSSIYQKVIPYPRQGIISPASEDGQVLPKAI